MMIRGLSCKSADAKWSAMDDSPARTAQFTASKHPTALGVACGAGAALCWALGFVAARHGILIGMSPLVLALHRYVWAGLVLIPVAAMGGFGDLGRTGLWRALAVTLFGGLPLALWSYYGYVYVPLGHGAIIQPSCAALGGLVLSSLVLGEALPLRRVLGGLAMIAGLIIIGIEALHTIGAHGFLGDMMFVAAGSSFAVFGMLLRLWRISPMPAVALTSIVSLAGLPLLLFSYENFLAAGLWQNLIQALVQGLFAGAGAVFLFTRSVFLLGASRAALFPALVPPFTLLIGFIALGEAPSMSQLIGLAVVVLGFWLTQKN
jgi:drug/metabolite transporter (DMT)-like permease